MLKGAEKAIDVIVPVYNGENFIKTVIQAFERQTFKDFKVIFVDDGSTDNSFDLLNESLKEVSFSNIVVHQSNKGLPGARNTGIKNADSRWITFVDCDDDLDSHFLEYLYRSVSENNTVLGYCDYQGIPFDHQDMVQPAGEYDCEVISAGECMQSYYTNWVGACCLIIDREWLLSKGLLFDEACTYCEDIPFITQVIEAADKVSRVSNKMYLYLFREGSLIRSPKIEKYKIGIDGFMRMADVLQKKDSEAAKVFQNMGKARYILATVRKGAVQVPLKEFKKLTGFIEQSTLREQVGNLPASQKIAGYLYLISKTLFYYSMRLLFKD